PTECDTARVALAARGLSAAREVIEVAKHCRDLVVDVVPRLWQTGPKTVTERERLLDLTAVIRDARVTSAMSRVALDARRSKADRVTALLGLANVVDPHTVAIVRRDPEPDELPVTLGFTAHVQNREPATTADSVSATKTLQEVASSDADAEIRQWGRLLLAALQPKSR